MQRIISNKGITLVALVVTIVILLILASVTLGMVLSNNGIFNMAKKATESYQIANEKEYIEQNVLSVQLDKYLGNVSSEKLGEILNTKSIENSSNWHIIKINEKSYETGWNYIEKGTELAGYGKAENSWLVNYETGEVIQLEEDNYINLSAGDMLAVKDSLIINVDSSIIDKDTEKDKSSIEKQLGENVTLEGFEETSTEESGLTSTSFNFDGKDDYIKVQYDKKEQKEALANRGFTFEFYGIWNGGTTDNRIKDNKYKGLFCYWNGDESQQAKFRFGIEGDGKWLEWNVATGRWNFSDFSGGATYSWNIMYDISKSFEKGKEIYLTISLDTSKSYNVADEKYVGFNDGNGNNKNGDFYKQTVYVNGEILYKGDYRKDGWSYFVNEELKDLKYFCIGRSSMTGEGYWNYSKMNAYCLRLYNRALSEDEVHKNYEKSVEYHSLLEK